MSLSFPRSVARRNSEGEKKGTNGDKSGSLRPRNRRSQTFTVASGNSDRLSTVKVKPAALLKLHKLHEFYMKIKDPEAFKQMQDTSPAAQKAAFSAEPSWQIHARLPDSYEKPQAQRNLEYWGAPQAGLIPGTETDAMLRHLGAALISTKGLKGANDTTIGQDSCSITKLRDGSEVFCVMDGHGEDGHWPATRASRILPFFLQGPSFLQMLSGGGHEAALTSVFEKTEKDLEINAREEKIKISYSGCTATVAIRDKVRDDLWVAHVGDSRAILLVPGEGVVYSTTDHKPTLEAELKRLEESGCVVVHYDYDDGDSEDRIFVKGEEYPGLNMSRSLGDHCVKDYGVVAEPEIQKWDMSAWKTAYYLACSDGIWEFLSSEEVAELVLESLSQGRSCQEAAKKLLKEARSLWLQHDPEYMDDITILLVPLDESTRRTRGALGKTLDSCGDCLRGISRGVMSGCAIS